MGNLGANWMDLQDACCMVNLEDDSYDNSEGDFILESTFDHTEATLDKAPNNEVSMAAGQASSEGCPEAIVVDNLPAVEEPSYVGIFRSWEVIKLCHVMGQAIDRYDANQIL